MRLDGVDIRELSLLWYRGQLALVSQCAPPPRGLCCSFAIMLCRSHSHNAHGHV